MGFQPCDWKRNGGIQVEISTCHVNERFASRLDSLLLLDVMPIASLHSICYRCALSLPGVARKNWMSQDMTWTPPHHFWRRCGFERTRLSVWKELDDEQLAVVPILPSWKPRTHDYELCSSWLSSAWNSQCKAQASAMSPCAFRITRKFIFWYPPSNRQYCAGCTW